MFPRWITLLTCYLSVVAGMGMRHGVGSTDTAILSGSSALIANNSDAWPHGPFIVVGAQIQDASGSNVTYAGVNWPGSLEVMIPEGLHYQSIEQIVGKIKSLGMNSIRLTYAIEMIDDILSQNNTDVPIKEALTKALGPDTGRNVLGQIIGNNPGFQENTTRLQVFGAVVSECAKQEIYVHLDNHVSKAIWCCDYTDGNAWWGDTYFSAANWTRGLTFMANWAKSYNNVMSMSLRNELRPPFTNETLLDNSYTWTDWYNYIRQGANAIHAANPDVLVFLSGLNSDEDLGPVTNGALLPPANRTLFNLQDFNGYGNKIVLELHAYEIVSPVTDCNVFKQELLNEGFQALTSNTSQRPVLLTEWGFTQNGKTYNDTYAQCLREFLPTKSSGWMIWTIGGSYYIRQGKVDYDEDWGLLNHNWTNWRDDNWVQTHLKPMVTASYEQTNPSSVSSVPSTSAGVKHFLGATGMTGSGAVWLLCVYWMLTG